jgi:hypothetical protein
MLVASAWSREAVTTREARRRAPPANHSDTLATCRLGGRGGATGPGGPGTTGTGSGGAGTVSTRRHVTHRARLPARSSATVYRDAHPLHSN